MRMFNRGVLDKQWASNSKKRGIQKKKTVKKGGLKWVSIRSSVQLNWTHPNDTIYIHSWTSGIIQMGPI